jgi:hypothetical protein
VPKDSHQKEISYPILRYFLRGVGKKKKYRVRKIVFYFGIGDTQPGRKRAEN